MGKITWLMQKSYYRFYQGIMKIAMKFLKYQEQQMIDYPGAIDAIPQIVKEQNLTSICLLCSKSVRRHGGLDSLLEGLEKEKIKYTIFEGIHSNTTTKNMEDGYAVYRKHNCDGIIAVGGGSVLDCAKIIGIKVSNPTLSFAEMKAMSAIKHPAPFMIAAPTTAGTGSESTVAAVVTDMEKKEKFAIVSFSSLPKIVILDANLTLGLPKDISAYTGMDALTHAMEAYIGNFGTAYTDTKALQAIKLIFENITKVYEDGSDLEARNNMLVASNLAGDAFTRTYVGYVHAISHALSALYDVGHGKTNAIVLPYVLKYYGKSIEKKLANIAKYVGIGSKEENEESLARQVIQKIESLNQKMGIPDKVEELLKKDIPIIVDKALKEANPSYPVPKIMDKKDCTLLVEKLIH